MSESFPSARPDGGSRRALGRGGPVLLGLAVAPLAVPGLAETGAEALVVGLVALSVLVTFGWLRFLVLHHGAAALLGAEAGARVLGDQAGGLGLPLALVAAVGAGALVGLAVLVPVARHARGSAWRASPQAGAVLLLSSLVVSALVWATAGARTLGWADTAPLLIGIDVGAPRSRYALLLGVALVALAVLGRLRRLPYGRRMAVAGGERELAERAGPRVLRLWAVGLALSGGLAGLAGWASLLGPPPPTRYGAALVFLPGLVLATLAVLLVVGSRRPGAVLAGAAALVVAGRIVDPVAVGAAALLAALALVPAGRLSDGVFGGLTGRGGGRSG